MRVPVDWGAPAALLAALACAGCAYIDSISWLPSNQTRQPVAYSPPTSRPPSYYAVRPGDTLGDIAFFYGVSVDALASENRIDDPDRIAVGERLLIPRPNSRAAVSAGPRPASRHATARKAAPADATRAALETRLHAADELVRGAHFEEALSETDRARADRRLDAAALGDDHRARALDLAAELAFDPKRALGDELPAHLHAALDAREARVRVGRCGRSRVLALGLAADHDAPPAGLSRHRGNPSRRRFVREKLRTLAHASAVHGRCLR
jgi:murein DD-endopeptidase MepM/ murein hydrolase activator NlpD